MTQAIRRKKLDGYLAASLCGNFKQPTKFLGPLEARFDYLVFVGDVYPKQLSFDLADVYYPSRYARIEKDLLHIQLLRDRLAGATLPQASSRARSPGKTEPLAADRALMLSMYDNREYVISAIRAGAAGYVLKDASSKEIITAIRAVAAGGSYYSAPLTTALATGGSEPPVLTEREREILILVAQGNSNKRIAQQLDVSVRTVETHRLNLRKKLGVETPAGLIRYALQQGWIKV